MDDYDAGEMIALKRAGLNLKQAAKILKAAVVNIDCPKNQS